MAQVVVRDAYGAPVAGAHVKVANANGPATELTTDANGVAFVAAAPGPVELLVSVPTFRPAVLQATLSQVAVTDVPVTLQRISAPAGGSMASRSGATPVQSADGRKLDFEVELVVVGTDAQPVDGLTAADFQLLACQPDAATPMADCLRNGLADHAYMAGGVATGLQVVAAQPVVAHTVGLLIDQSGSIAGNDRLNGRLFAAKALLSSISAGDQALIGAFADGTGAQLPQQPLTVLGSVADAAAASQMFAPLDALAGQSGGQTPLHTAIDAMRLQLVANPSLRPGLPRGLAVFTDGADSYCTSGAGCAQQRQQVIDAARADGVRLFTIGLSGSIDVEALSQLANASGGAMLYADTVEQLLPLYGSLGKLMSLGLPTYRLRFSVDAGEAGVFASGQTVLARVRVQVRGQAVDIPLAVNIP
ncbi:MAG: VWA domain-containing protein [Aquabacterium sp.]|nr:VWA domain-containing protein [Aquabacterium sp.]